MEKAFEYIVKALGDELAKLNFGEGKGIEDAAGPAVMFTSGAVAYSVVYNEKQKLFELRSTVLDEDGRHGAWKSLSKWIYNEEAGDDFSVAQSIAADFCDTVRGPQRLLQTQQLKGKKKKTEDENYIEPLFFFNRLCSVFPELKREMNEERVVYGQVRTVYFAREKVAPKLEALLASQSIESEAASKAVTVLCDNYKNGDRDTRAIITAVVLNSLGDAAYGKLLEKLEGDLKDVAPAARRLRGKKIKPEKEKKTKGFVADNLNSTK